MGQKNLLLHYFPKMLFRSDFDAIAQRIHANTSDIAVKVLATDRPHPWTMLSAAGRPTVSVEFHRAKFTPCLRGKVFRQWRRGSKSDQYRVLEAAGISVPQWALVTPETRLDPVDWGDYVVEKPDRGARGAYVRVKRTGRVRYKDPETMEEDNPGRRAGMLVQHLIDTGPVPVSYRVKTFFGTPILALRYDGGREPWYKHDGQGQRKITGSSVVATGRGCRITFANETDLLDLGRRTHAAFADLPVLGIDMVRDVSDGRLWVLEVNPEGDTWNFGCRGGHQLMKAAGLDFYKQFDALDRCAEALTELCRREAV